MTFLNQLHFNWFSHPKFKVGNILGLLPKKPSLVPPIEVVEVFDGGYLVQYQLRNPQGGYDQFKIGIENVDKYYIIKE